MLVFCFLVVIVVVLCISGVNIFLNLILFYGLFVCLFVFIW